ncbi:MAG: hypothetical protein Q8N63_09140 [Nanoarchaeota archaeon]|nr:hypothetical protein [Nanoarchaeota archaeon]
MKRIWITICLVVMFVVGSAFADVEIEQGDKGKITMPNGSIVGGDQTIVDIKNVKFGGVKVGDISGGSAVAHGGEGGNAKAIVGDTTNLNKNSNSNDIRSSSNLNVSVEDKVQGQAIVPMDMMPRVIAEEKENNLWNKRSGPSLSGSFTLKELRQRKNDQGINFVDLKVKVKGSRIMPLGLFHRYPESKTLIVRDLVDDQSIGAINGVYVHTIYAHAGSDVTLDACIYKALEEAANWGARVVTVEYGLNSVAKGTGLQIGGNGVKSNADGSVTGGGGAGVTYALWVGDPWCRVVMYR